jgi:hypothetical protein
MDISLAIGCLCVGAVLGALVVVGWKSDGKPLVDQLTEIRQSETPEDITRRTQA